MSSVFGKKKPRLCVRANGLGESREVNVLKASYADHQIIVKQPSDGLAMGVLPQLDPLIFA